MKPLPGSELALRSATELVAALKSGTVGSRELLEVYLERIARLNPPLNAVVTLDAERARKAADAADHARSRGQSLGPLHGLPMTVKDTLETAGIRTTAGAPITSTRSPDTAVRLSRRHVVTAGDGCARIDATPASAAAKKRI